MNTIDDERLSKRAVKPSVALSRLCNARQDNPADGQLRKEVIVLLIAELVEPGSHGHVVRHLDETAGLGDIRDVSQRQITLLERQCSTILEDFVTHVCVLLALLVVGEKLATCALRLDQAPEVVT